MYHPCIPTCLFPSPCLGWALTLLSQDNLSFASTAQTIGLNTGYFLSFTVFLALNSPEFAYVLSCLLSCLVYRFQTQPMSIFTHRNKYVRSVPLDDPLVTLGGYLQFSGLFCFVVTLWLVLFKTEVCSLSACHFSSFKITRKC